MTVCFMMGWILRPAHLSHLTASQLLYLVVHVRLYRRRHRTVELLCGHRVDLSRTTVDMSLLHRRPGGPPCDVQLYYRIDSGNTDEHSFQQSSGACLWSIASVNIISTT